jgi:hypothetical protein
VVGVTAGCLPGVRCEPGDDATCPKERVCASDGRCVLPAELDERADRRSDGGEGEGGEGGEGEGREGEGEGGEGEGEGELPAHSVGDVIALGEWRRVIVATGLRPFFAIGGAQRLDNSDLRVGAVRMDADGWTRAHVVTIDRESGDIDGADLGIVGAASSAPTLVDDSSARAVVALSMGLTTRLLGWDLDDAPPRPVRLDEQQEANAEVAAHVCDDEFGQSVLVWADYQAVRARTIDDVTAPGAPRTLVNVDASHVDCAGRLAVYESEGEVHAFDVHTDEEVWSTAADAGWPVHAVRTYAYAVVTYVKDGHPHVAMFDGALLDADHLVDGYDGVNEAVPYARNGRRGAVVQARDSSDLDQWELGASGDLLLIETIAGAGSLVQAASGEDLFVVVDGEALAYVHPG